MDTHQGLDMKRRAGQANGQRSQGGEGGGHPPAPPAVAARRRGGRKAAAGGEFCSRSARRRASLLPLAWRGGKPEFPGQEERAGELPSPPATPPAGNKSPGDPQSQAGS
uniref:Uncharacterized protein n=1 Tax=Pelusios castaneus TaxID=367368 RepID=A0A8C8R801_9SAUR